MLIMTVVTVAVEMSGSPQNQHHLKFSGAPPSLLTPKQCSGLLQHLGLGAWVAALTGMASVTSSSCCMPTARGEIVAALQEVPKLNEMVSGCVNNEKRNIALSEAAC